MKISFQLHVSEPLQITPEAEIDDPICQFAPESTSKTIPIIQLFGRTAEEAICVNVRGLYPYFYLEYPDTFWDFAILEGFSKELGIHIEHVVGRGTIYKICCVRGRRYYGFDQFKRPFFKISFFSTFSCKKAAEALSTSKVLSRRFICYEVHIPFELQFLVDHNIYGMGRVDIQNVQPAYIRHSKCLLEYNAHAKDILNRRELFPLFNFRPDGLGLFPDRHLMPSVVQMLNNMGFDPSTLLIDLKDRSTSSRVSISGIQNIRDLEDKNCEFVDSATLNMFPAANDPYLEDFERDFQQTPNDLSFMQLLKSPLFGSQISKTHFDEAINEFEQKISSSSPIKTPTKPKPKSIATAPSPVSFSSGEDNVEQYLEEMLEEATTQCILDFASSSPVKTPVKRKQCATKITLRRALKGVYKPRLQPPTVAELSFWADTNPNFPWAVQQVPFYSKDQDRPTRPVIIAGTKCEVPLILKRPFPGSQSSLLKFQKGGSLMPALPPPIIPLLPNITCSFPDDRLCPSSQITGITQVEKFPKALKSQLGEQDNFVIFSVEIHAGSSEGKFPDPKRDPVQMAVYSVYQNGIGYTHGCISQAMCHNASNFLPVTSEMGLFEQLEELVTIKYNADILLGYEVQMSSWGYLEERLMVLKGESLAKRLSRKLEDPKGTRSSMPNEWERRKSSTFQVFGRIVLNVRRIMRSELNLYLYSFESVVSHVLKQNFPKFDSSHLSRLYESDIGRERLFCYYNVRSKANIELLIKTEVLTRSCEFARLFGVDIYSVLTRGSQYKVESLMARLAHLENFLLFSPSKEDVGGMRAAEQTPLIMEPAGKTYVDPVIVLDFQSLYPSIMIAYNFCFSTIIKRVERDDGRLGAMRLGTEAYGRIQNPIIAANGAAFTPKSLRQGVMPKMQTELLDARLQIKKRMKAPGVDATELKILDARQAALKYILNVSYGYTAASFSGRMPCVEVADAIVATGRATMDRAIRLIETHSTWRAKVVYGDTDSLFVLVPGRTRKQAFEIGQEIDDAVTAQNPAPMTLKLEKVYQPCCLMAKKRYVGFKYESPEQAEPLFDAKGIETVRRDSCPLVSQILEKSIRILFTTKDISAVKAYVMRQFHKISKGARHDLGEFMFARQVKFGTYRNEAATVYEENESADEDGEDSEKEEAVISTRLPPSAYLAAKRMQKDPRDIAQYGERIPFVVIENGSSRLVDQVVSPQELYSDPTLKINSNYYITRQILPALARVLNTVGVEPRLWWASMAKSVNIEPTSRGIGRFFAAANCWFCKQSESEMRMCSSMDGQFKFQICSNCWREKKLLYLKAYALAIQSHQKLAKLAEEAHETCWNTDPFDPTEKCWSLTCPVFWKSVALNRKEAMRYRDSLKVMEYFEMNPD